MTPSTEAASFAAEATSPPKGVTRFSPVLEGAPPPGFALPGLFARGGRVEVIEDERGIAMRIASRLANLGIDACSVARATGEASGIIFAQGLLARDSQEDAIAVQRTALEIARAMARREARNRVFVTLQDTGGDFGASGRGGERAWSGGLAGLTKTAAAEWPDAAVKAIDVAALDAPPDIVAERVVAELLLGGRDVEVAIGPDGARSIVVHRRAEYAPGAECVRRGAVLVVSGGARGVTAASLEALCKHGPRLALLGRTPLTEDPVETAGAATDAELRRALLTSSTHAGAPLHPKELAREAKRILDCREIRRNIATLEHAGAEVTYHAIDVRSASDVRACVDAIRKRWGAIQGIIHGAGVLADALLANQTEEQFDRVFGTKVDGLRHLLAATENDPLELLIVFSSVAGRLGNPAQSVYSMANETLSIVAANEKARRSQCLVRSLAWGPWAGGMVTPGLAKLFEKAGVDLIALDVGAEALARETSSHDASSQVVLMNGEPPATARPIQGGRIFRGEECFEVLVNNRTYPQLDGHRIPPGGAPVVPVALVIEWFFSAAAACVPGVPLRRCRDLKVLRGVSVEGFDRRGVRLLVQARVIDASADGAKTLEMKLVDEEQRPRYSAFVDLADSPTAPPTEPVVGAPHSGASSIWSIEQIYSELLFHRAPFAGIRSLDRVFDESATAEVLGLTAACWPKGRWSSDPALIDAGLQLACVWGLHVLGGVPLPTSVGALDLYVAGAIDSPVRCVLRGQRAGQRRVLVDLAYLDGDRILAAMRGIEMHLPLAVDATTHTTGAA